MRVDDVAGNVWQACLSQGERVGAAIAEHGSVGCHLVERAAPVCRGRRLVPARLLQLRQAHHLASLRLLMETQDETFSESTSLFLLLPSQYCPTPPPPTPPSPYPSRIHTRPRTRPHPHPWTVPRPRRRPGPGMLGPFTSAKRVGTIQPSLQRIVPRVPDLLLTSARL